MVIADTIAHAIDPPLLFSLHQQVEELEVILVEIQAYLADLADLVVQDKVHEVDQKGPRCLGRERNIRIIEGGKIWGVQWRQTYNRDTDKELRTSKQTWDPDLFQQSSCHSRMTAVMRSHHTSVTR